MKLKKNQKFKEDGKSVKVTGGGASKYTELISQKLGVK